MNLCKYSDIFGKPNEGVHSYRFFDVAIVDFIITIIVGFLISYFFNLSFIYTLIFLFVLGIFLHRLFCVKTTVDKLLFGNQFNMKK